ncbi:MAG: hypothetical protein IPN69_03440 [Acidobacteria bacterium]|nr:hypothetical protein [Acidobacteriota bacterium]
MFNRQTKFIGLLCLITIEFALSCRQPPPVTPAQKSNLNSDLNIVGSGRFLPTDKADENQGYYDFKVMRLSPPNEGQNGRIIVSDEKGNTVYDQSFTVLVSAAIVPIEHGSEQLVIRYNEYASTDSLRILSFSSGTLRVFADDLAVFGTLAFLPDEDVQLAAQSPRLLLDIGRAKSDFGMDFSVRMYRLEEGVYRYVRAVDYKRILKELREGPKSNSAFTFVRNSVHVHAK